jgi:(p)ppGpp synthase/HD superfamily hydrolase
MKPMARLIFDRWDEYCRQKYSEDCYNDHILEVEMALGEDLGYWLMDTESQLITRCIAIGHDLLEDTDATEEEMRQYVAEEVVEGIKILTKPKGMPYLDYIRRVIECGDERVIMVKRADMYDHVIKKRATLTPRLKEKYSEAIPYLIRQKRFEDG